MATFSEPRILLLDEHTAALDPQRADLVSRLTADIVAEQNLTTVMVTHNMDQALRLGNRLIMMHEGRILFELDAAQKQSMTVPGLLEQFRRLQPGAGQEAFDDATLFESVKTEDGS
jgi:putative ABC transport system ATP-binding protein